MDVSVRHRTNQDSVIINPSGVVYGSHTYGNQLPAKGRNGALYYRPFGGVIDNDTVFRYQCIKLCNVTEFYWNDIGFGEGYAIPKGHVVKGCYLNGKYYIAIKDDDTPLHFLDR